MASHGNRAVPPNVGRRKTSRNGVWSTPRAAQSLRSNLSRESPLPSNPSDGTRCPPRGDNTHPTHTRRNVVGMRMVRGGVRTCAPANLLTLVRTMKVVAVTSCCTRNPAYEIARPLRQESCAPSYASTRTHTHAHTGAADHGKLAARRGWRARGGTGQGKGGVATGGVQRACATMEPKKSGRQPWLEWGEATTRARAVRAHAPRPRTLHSS